MSAWIYRDPHDGTYDVCEDWTDSVGPDFREAELDEDFVAKFARAQLAYEHFQAILASLWNKERK